MGEMLAIRSLGGLIIERNGQPVTDFDSRKVQALLVYVVCTGRAQPREVLAEMFWEERAQDRALANLRTALTSLRQTVGPFVTITRDTVGVDPGAEIVFDVAEFETQLAAAGTDVTRLSAVLDLYQGDFLAGFYVDSAAFEEWATRERERWRLRALEALDTLIGCHQAAGDYAAGIACANRLLDLDNLREATHRQLMELLWRAGERAAALAQYDTCCRLLAEELGVEPTAETTALYECIHAGESPPGPEPDTIRGYRVRERIGTGGFGEVYRAWQPVVEREVAIKVIRPEYANQPDFIRRFETEAQLIARLEHPNIVPLYDYWREPGGAYLVMRYLKESLLARLGRGPLNVSECVRLVEQVCAALTVAHRNGVVHRDLKPANILLDEDGNAYLSDFGIAKVLGDMARVTQDGMLVGSPAYLSPEQARSEPVTPASDIYSFGILVFEALAGQPPFSGDGSPVALLHKQLTEPLPSLLERCPELPPELDTVLQRATSKDPAHRYPDALSLATAFREAAGSAGRRTAPRPAPVQVVAPPDEHTWTPADSLVAVRNPYKGLAAFKEADAADFFGREALVAQLAARLNEDHPLARFLAIVGPSGSGKSSVARAGLLAALRAGALPGSENWFFAEMLPGARPLDELEIALLRVAIHQPPGLIEQLSRDAHGLVRAARLILPEDGELVLLVDQFEEAFMLVEDPAHTRHLLDLLQAATTDPRSPVRVIVTLRADFYDRPLMYAEFGDLLRQRTEVVLPMTPDELERAITGPAEGAGVLIEPRLVAAIVAEVSEQPGALPMLQYALTELFERRRDLVVTQNAYDALGGVMGVLAGRADEVYRALDPAEQHAARQLFLRLVTLGDGTEDTRRRVPEAELLSLGGEVMGGVVDAFAASRLLTFDRDPVTRGPTVEVAHEALLREWPLLRGWLDESRHDIRQQRLLAVAALEWSRADEDPSYLLRGSRLAQFEDWAGVTDLALTQDEIRFLDASLAEQQRQIALEHARQQQELALQKRAANRLRYLVAGLTVFLAVAVLLALYALDARSSAEDARQDAQRQADVRQSLALAASAKEALLTHNTDLAVALALEAYSVDDPPVEVEQVLAEAIYAPGTRHVLAGHGGPVGCAAYSPDGRYVLSGGGSKFSQEVRGVYIFFPQESGDYDLRLWDTATGETVRTFAGHTGAVWDVALNQDGTQALSASSDHTVILWDVASGQPVRRFEHTSTVRAVDFSPDGTQALAGDDHQLILWDLVTGEAIHNLYAGPGLQYQVWSIDFHPTDGRYALAGHGPRGYITDGYMLLWDLETGEVARQYDMKSTPYAVTFSPDGTQALATGYTILPGSFDLTVDDSFMVLWDLESGEEIRRFVHGWVPLFGTAFSPDGRLAISAAADQLIIVWDVTSGEVLHRLGGHSNWIVDAAYSPDGEHLVTAAEDHTLRIWDLRNGAEVWQRHEHITRAGEIRVSADGVLALSGGLRDMVLWDVATGDVIHHMLGHTGGVGGRFGPDGQTLISSSCDQTVRFWNIASGEELRRVFTDSCIWSMAITPDGRYGVMAEAPPGNMIGTEKEIQPVMRDLETGEAIRRFIGHTGIVVELDISPDGRTLATAAEDNTLRLWDLATGEELRRFEGHDGLVNTVDFSPDGRFILSGSADRTLILWAVETGEMVRRFEGHSLRVRNVTISPDGRTALSTSEDNHIILWDLATGKELRRFKVLEWGGAEAVRFTPDGTHFLATGRDGDVYLWRLVETPEQIIAWGQVNRYMRDLSCDEREAYDVIPRCDAGGTVPTRTPFPTWAASPDAPGAERPTATVPLTLRALPSVTPLPTRTARPAATPADKGALTAGVSVVGQVLTSMGDRPAGRDAWTYDGTAGEAITLNNGSAGLHMALYDPGGGLLIEDETPQIGPVTLPETGTYTVIVSTGSTGIAGPYTLMLVSGE